MVRKASAANRPRREPALHIGGFVIAAFTIWLAPRPRAGVDISAAH